MEEKLICEPKNNIRKAASLTGLLLLTGTIISGCATNEYYTKQPYDNTVMVQDLNRVHNDIIHDYQRATNNLYHH